MSGPAPKDPAKRRRRNVPARGEMQDAPGIGWQHGRRPKSPTGLKPESQAAWASWFAAWFASFWTPADVPALRQIVLLYDQVERGEFHRQSELRLQMKAYGISPEGQMALRWRAPAEPLAPPQPKARSTRHGHLKAVEDA